MPGVVPHGDRYDDVNVPEAGPKNVLLNMEVVGLQISRAAPYRRKPDSFVRLDSVQQTVELGLQRLQQRHSSFFI